MPSAIQIANRALTKLGDDRILSFSDQSKPARTMASMFDQVRDQELRRNHWKFAIKRDAWTADADAPSWGYDYAYTLPADYLGLVQVGETYVKPLSKDQGTWSVEGSKLLTSLPPQLRVRYVSRVDNPGLWDVLFAECVACKLALEACEVLTQSSSKKQGIQGEYQFALAEAARCDAIENPPTEMPWGSWLESREGALRSSTAVAIITAASIFYGASGFTIGDPDPVSNPPDSGLITERGDFLVTENGDYIVFSGGGIVTESGDSLVTESGDYIVWG